MLRGGARCSSVRFGEMVLSEIYPSPSIYWIHDVREKKPKDLLESIAWGQNLALNGLSKMSPRIRSFTRPWNNQLIADWAQGQMSQWLCDLCGCEVREHAL